jgi:hypothetical protein
MTSWKRALTLGVLVWLAPVLANIGLTDLCTPVVTTGLVLALERGR